MGNSVAALRENIFRVFRYEHCSVIYLAGNRWLTPESFIPMPLPTATISIASKFPRLVLFGLAIAFTVPAGATPEPIGFKGIAIGGELRERLERNFTRLESPRFQPNAAGCFRDKDYDWPGDMEGRTLLALALLEQAAGHQAVYLRETLAGFPGHMNPAGYFGKESASDPIDEQQLAGHGWVLRGLCERYLATKEPATLQLIESIINHLALPTKGAHAGYPILPADRVNTKGSYMGTAVQQLGHWKLSTDIGCDFIFMDGVMQAATILKRADVNALADEMVARFLEVDLASIKAQTHASLTGIRAVLRWAAFTGRQDLLAAAEQRFQLYLAEGMSENQANWNWFGRPTHTEPCAVVDSFMIAVQLWQQTGKPAYLEQAHLIYYNALGHGQRANGGFGCDTCLGAETATLKIKIVEAWWCCTMRGSEGLSRAAEYAFMQEPGALILPFFHPGTARLETAGGVLQVETKTNYPYEGELRLKVVSAPAGQVEIRLFVPSWAKSPTITLDGELSAGQPLGQFLAIKALFHAGDELVYRFDQSVRTESLGNQHDQVQGYQRTYYGPLLLGAEGAPDVTLPRADAFTWNPTTRSARAPGLDFALRPINDLILRADVTEKNYERRALWKTE